MNVLNWIITNWDNIVVLVVTIVGVILAIRNGGKSKIIAMAVALCTEAEAEFGGGTGALKKAQVVTWVYEKLPDILKLIISEKAISAFVELGLQEAKTMWDKNTAVATYIETKTTMTVPTETE